MQTERMAVVLSALLLGSSVLQAQAPSGEWRFYGGDAGSSHYSPLTQINKSNLSKLRVAWEWKIGEMAPQPASPGFEATPLMIDDVLYFPAPYFHVIAANATTGKQLWNYDPHIFEWEPARQFRQQWDHDPRPEELGVGDKQPVYASSARGLGSWTDGKKRRIFLPARGRLFALDAATGELIPSFGNEGVVDITEDLVWKVKNRNEFNNSSPPVVYKNLVIVGSSIPDGINYFQNPPGDIQAFDAVTGKRVWSFHTIPQKGEFGNETWENGSWNYTGHANAWPPITLDEQRGLVYIPVTSPSNDYYGGMRHGNNLFGDSLVCLDANTGKRVWHFQTIHHDIWDYDGVHGITLLTIHVNGKAIDVVAAEGKTGFTYVFDRVTGKPVWPIEERPVPQTDVPGEKTSPTQPFPTKPPPFAKQGFTPDDVVDFTPEIKKMAMDWLKPYRAFTTLFTPPSLQGTLYMPSVNGGGNWGGASVDPRKGLLYVVALNWPRVVRIVRDFSKDKDVMNLRPDSESSEDYVSILPLIAGGIPINKPPYATLTAMDLNKGEILWQQTIGDTPAIHNHPLLKGVNIPPTGILRLGGTPGVLVTAGNLLFQGPGDKTLYARDPDNGKVLWTGELKNNVAGTPMTYRTKSGKQFVVVATGTGKDATLVAFSLP